MSTNTTGSWFSPTPTSVTITATATSGTITASSNTIIANSTWNPSSTVSFPTLDESTGISFVQNGKEVFRYSTDLEAVEAMIQWIFENTTGRFYSLGTSRWFFELEEDAVAFKLVFKGHSLVD